MPLLIFGSARTRLRYFLIFNFLWILQSCITGVKVSSTHSLGEIRAAIKMIAGDIKAVDPDRRRFETNYFVKNLSSSGSTMKANQRYFARFTIAGDKRPYEIVIQVFREVRIGGKWIQDGQDLSLAQRISSDLENALKDLKQQRNVIDSFRPF